jgi:integrase
MGSMRQAYVVESCSRCAGATSNWAASVIRVRRSYSRGEFGTPQPRRSSRAVPLADALGGELERRLRQSRFTDHDDLVFAHPLLGTVLGPSKVQKRFKKAVGRAGLQPVRFHDLRHTFGTRMAAAGTPLRAIQERMGHKDSRTTSLYGDYAPDPASGAGWAALAFASTTVLRGGIAREALSVLGDSTRGTY